jgi:hypothetical protein
MRKVEAAANRVQGRGGAGAGAGGGYLERFGRIFGRESKFAREGSEFGSALFGLEGGALAAKIGGAAALLYAVSKAATVAANSVALFNNETLRTGDKIEGVIKSLPFLGEIYTAVDEAINGAENRALAYAEKEATFRRKAMEQASATRKKMSEQVKDQEHENATALLGAERKAVADEEYAAEKRQKQRERDREAARALGGIGYRQFDQLAKRAEAADAEKLANVRRRAQELPAMSMSGDTGYYRSPFARSALPQHAGARFGVEAATASDAKSRDVSIMEAGQKENSESWRKNLELQQRAVKALESIDANSKNTRILKSLN